MISNARGPSRAADGTPGAPPGDLSLTALYTAGVWASGGVEGAEALAGDDTRAVYRWVERVLALVRLLRPGLPRLRSSLLLRHALIDHLARGEPDTTLVEVGVGLSPRPLVEARRGRPVLEVDLPAMMAARRARLAEHGVEVPASLRSIEGDLLDLSPLASLVTEPATVVVEGVFPYLERETRARVWRDLARLLAPHGGRLVFDLNPADEEPRPGLVGRLLGWLFRRLTRGARFTRGHATRAEIHDDLLAAGFTRVAAYDPAHPPEGCALPEVRRPAHCVVFEAAMPASATRPAG